MKMDIRRYGRELLAGMLSLALAVQLFLGMQAGVKAANGQYTQMRFSDWGVSEGPLYDMAETYSLTEPGKIESLDGVAVSGKVNFNGTNNAYFRIGGPSYDLRHAGFKFVNLDGSLVVLADGIGGDSSLHEVVSGEEWAAMSSKELALRILFDRDKGTGVWSVGLEIDGTSYGTYDCGAATPGLYFAVNALVTVDMTPQEEKTYIQMRFSDWGVSEGPLYDMAETYSLTEPGKIESLDGVAVSGKVNFNGTNNAYFRIGGPSYDLRHAGFKFVNLDGSLVVLADGIGGDSSLHEVASGEEWAVMSSREIALQILFDRDKGTGVWSVGIEIDGTSYGTYDCGAATPGLYFAVNALVTVDMTPQEEKPDKPEPPASYTELAFADFGIYNGFVNGADIYSLKGHADIKSLDGVAISGKVNFNGTTMAKIRFGGTEKLKHAGFWLFDDGSNVRLSPQGIGGKADYYVMREDSWKPLRDKEIGLRVTFDRDQTTGSWKVGVFVNGELAGTFDCGAAEPGMYLGVDPAITVEGLGDRVKNSGLDFTLFGYSNENWQKEMGL